MNQPEHAGAPIANDRNPAAPLNSIQIPGVGVHVPALDGIRGLAILMVIIFHVTKILPSMHVEIPLTAFRLLCLGQTGVDLFFVLSGFLITGILLDTRTLGGRFVKFYGRRTLRIFPLYYAVLVIGVLSTIAVTGKAARDEGIHWFWLFSYLGNVPPTWGCEDPSFGHFWSLAVEEQFYLIWPAIVYLLPIRLCLAISMAMVVVAPVNRIAFEQFGLSSFYPTLCRTDALGIGAVIAICIRNAAITNRLRNFPALGRVAGLATLIICMAIALATTFKWHQFNWAKSMKPTLCALVFAIFITQATFCSPASWLSRTLNTRFLRSTGKYSYAMYVFHPFVILALQKCFSSGTGPLSWASALLFGLAAIAATFAIAQVSWYSFERPLLSLKALFSY